MIFIVNNPGVRVRGSLFKDLSNSINRASQNLVGRITPGVKFEPFGIGYGKWIPNAKGEYLCPMEPVNRTLFGSYSINNRTKAQITKSICERPFEEILANTNQGTALELFLETLILRSNRG